MSNNIYEYMINIMRFHQHLSVSQADETLLKYAKKYVIEPM